ncbi:MAG: alpha-amylase, partial [Aestuariibacter sp.]|nr:alpha-amylase [Aestuariibacter sp.]
QVGFGADGATPDDSWTWVDMGFNADAGNNDEYFGNLLPDMLGAFDYVTRYSADGGSTWFYADLNGPGINGNPGDLQVVASADTTAPAAPTGTAVTGTSSSDISIGWDAHPDTDGDLVGFELYREHTATPGFSRIASVDAGTTSFVDTGVATGETYNYYVVAYDTSFNRSAASNSVTATAEPRLVSVTFNIGVPAYTPGTVYIVGGIDAFGPWDPGFVVMTQVDATTWTYTVDILDGTALDYKFTRGTWDTVEAWGNIVGLANRQLTISYGTDGTQLVDLTATDWGNGSDDEKAVQLWRDPIVTSHTPVDG